MINVQANTTVQDLRIKKTPLSSSISEISGFSFEAYRDSDTRNPRQYTAYYLVNDEGLYWQLWKNSIGLMRNVVLLKSVEELIRKEESRPYRIEIGAYNVPVIVHDKVTCSVWDLILKTKDHNVREISQLYNLSENFTQNVIKWAEEFTETHCDDIPSTFDLTLRSKLY